MTEKNVFTKNITSIEDCETISDCELAVQIEPKSVASAL